MARLTPSGGIEYRDAVEPGARVASDFATAIQGTRNVLVGVVPGAPGEPNLHAVAHVAPTGQVVALSAGGVPVPVEAPPFALVGVASLAAVAGLALVVYVATRRRA